MRYWAVGVNFRWRQGSGSLAWLVQAGGSARVALRWVTAWVQGGSALSQGRWREVGVPAGRRVESPGAGRCGLAWGAARSHDWVWSSGRDLGAGSARRSNPVWFRGGSARTARRRRP
ncbi:hypothetical protein HPP92_009053 [Vanilla planifolia]|uniref:Uncharacterized protein n=1 Tax=Vanilla planifolia TaxID=51239 RepID=A0A835RAS6_VANPL|nr:hypothetical protein HPP92_009286 [Vanilla planifolia]KAG0486958.1 hypothetical protein HPP92_009053 [Vanilla planifolia]